MGLTLPQMSFNFYMNFEQIQKELDYYQKFTPVNFAEERTKFFESVKKNQSYNPLFKYANKLDVKDFEKINFKRKDKVKLYFPPDAFHVYSELFKKLI